MKRSIGVRKPGSSTADVLTSDSDSSNATAPSKSNQPSDGISKVVFGGQEAQSLLNKDREAWSGSEMKEMSGSAIFGSEPTNMYQGISQIAFSAQGQEQEQVAKQRELRGILPSQSDSKHKTRISNSKYKEMSGHHIFAFAPPPSHSKQSMGTHNVPTSTRVSIPPGGLALSGEPVIRTTKKIQNKKFQDLTGNDIFKEAIVVDHGSVKKKLSRAKLQEMRGNDIFSDGKVESRDYLGGIRKPPGGESSISLI